jgi:signal transduction histidine kinase
MRTGGPVSNSSTGETRVPHIAPPDSASLPSPTSVREDDLRVQGLVPMLRLHWFIRLRWIFLGAAVGVLALERFVLKDAERPLALAGILIGLALANLAWVIVSNRLFWQVQDDPVAVPARRRQLVIFANAQVAVDLFLLTGILRYTGGAENPLAIFYLFHMAIVAQVLRRWQAILQGAWALLLYALLVVGEWRQWIAPHYEFLPHTSGTLYTRPEYVVAVLAVVGCGIFGMLYFALHVADQADRRERDLHRANAALNRAQLAIQDLQRRRSRFMQTAAHQLKTPLAVIQTLTDLIRTKVVPPEAIPDTCDKIVRRCQDGMGQVSELLTLARVQDAEPGRHRASEADVRQVVTELCNRFKPLADGKQVELTWLAPEDRDLPAAVDARDLRDCLSNLIDNAIKYTQSPGRVTVTVTYKQPAGNPPTVAINVTDTGMGIDPNLLTPPDGQAGHEPVFDAFRRGNNAILAGIPGTGLGLSIVREVVEQAGGRILLSSRPGQGSSFTVTFPLHGPQYGEEPGREPEQPAIRDTRAAQIVRAEPRTDHQTEPRP